MELVLAQSATVAQRIFGRLRYMRKRVGGREAFLGRERPNLPAELEPELVGLGRDQRAPVEREVAWCQRRVDRPSQRVGDDEVAAVDGLVVLPTSPPMLWRYATVQAGARLDSARRYVLGRPGPTPQAFDAVKRFLRFYGPASVDDFADWAGLAKPHASRLWEQVGNELAEVAGSPRGKGWIAREDTEALDSPPDAKGIRLIPPGIPTSSGPTGPCSRRMRSCESVSSGRSRVLERY
jgi:hypothetical protein